MLSYRDNRFETVLWEGDVVRLGTFEASASDPEFATAGQVVSSPSLAFARRPVKIRWRRHQDLLADVDRVVLHNVGNTYRRVAVSAEGDRSDWFHFSPRILGDALERSGLPCSPDVKHPFRHEWAAVDGGVCLLRTALIHGLSELEPDPLFIEETSLLILDRVLSGVPGAAPRNRGAARPGHRDLAEAARETLAKRWSEPLRLEDVAEDVGVSLFHLCRVFRSQTGTTLHRHLRQIRLRRSLEHVVERDSDLSAIAFDHGFSSHSHFTASFRSVFGITPSAFRDRAASGSVQLLLRDVPEPPSASDG